MSTEPVHTFLQDQLRHLPQADSIGLISATGRLINFSRRWPVPSWISQIVPIFSSYAIAKTGMCSLATRSETGYRHLDRPRRPSPDHIRRNISWDRQRDDPAQLSGRVLSEHCVHKTIAQSLSCAATACSSSAIQSFKSKSAKTTPLSSPFTRSPAAVGCIAKRRARMAGGMGIGPSASRLSACHTDNSARVVDTGKLASPIVTCQHRRTDCDRGFPLAFQDSRQAQFRPAVRRGSASPSQRRAEAARAEAEESRLAAEEANYQLLEAQRIGKSATGSPTN